MIDRTAKALSVMDTVYQHARSLKLKGLNLGELRNEVPHMETMIGRGKLSPCACSNWDMMLSNERSTRKQRQADYDNIDSTVQKSCAQTYPAQLKDLLKKWVAGEDVMTLVP